MSEAEFWEIARRVCTERELEVLGYLGKGWSEHKTAELLRVSRSTVRSHYENASRKIRQEVAAMRGIQ